MQEVLVKALNTVSTVRRCTPISSLGGPDSHQDDEDGEREDEEDMDDEESDEKIDISGGGSDVGENIAVENLSNFVVIHKLTGTFLRELFMVLQKLSEILILFFFS